MTNDELSKHEKKKLKIIAAASRLFVAQKGIKKTSLADIARELGISKGTLYYYYASKDDLIFDITEHHMRQISDDMFALIDQRPGRSSLESILKAMVEAILNARTRSHLHLYLIREAMSGNDAIRKRFVKTYRDWFALTQSGLEKVMGAGDFSLMAPIVVAVLDGFVIQSTLDVQEVPVADIVRYLVRMADA